MFDNPGIDSERKAVAQILRGCVERGVGSRGEIAVPHELSVGVGSDKAIAIDF